MAEYIDREWLRKWAKEVCGGWDDDQAEVEGIVVLKMPEQAPTVDAVEVVRCKDCIGKATWYKNDYGCIICGLSGLFVVQDSDFCSYGERRADNAVCCLP